jgi:hypothetical protein
VQAREEGFDGKTCGQGVRLLAFGVARPLFPCGLGPGKAQGPGHLGLIVKGQAVGLALCCQVQGRARGQHKGVVLLQHSAVARAEGPGHARAQAEQPVDLVHVAQGPQAVLQLRFEQAGGIAELGAALGVVGQHPLAEGLGGLGQHLVGEFMPEALQHARVPGQQPDVQQRGQDLGVLPGQGQAVLEGAHAMPRSGPGPRADGTARERSRRCGTAPS